MTYGHLQADCLYAGISSGPTLGVEYCKPLPLPFMEIGLGAVNIVLDAYPAPPNFRPMSVFAKRLYQDATWYGDWLG